MDNIVAKNKNGAWEIRTTLTNNDENVSFDGTLKIVGPSKWTDSIQPVDVKLEPGEELRVDEIQSSISKQKVSVQNSTNWINSDIMIFEDTPLRQVVNCLSRRYGVRIHVQGEICNIKYTGKNSGRNIGDVFRLLEVTSPVPISVTEYEGEYYISRNK